MLSLAVFSFDAMFGSSCRFGGETENRRQVQVSIGLRRRVKVTPREGRLLRIWNTVVREDRRDRMNARWWDSGMVGWWRRDKKMSEVG